VNDALTLRLPQAEGAQQVTAGASTTPGRLRTLSLLVALGSGLLAALGTAAVVTTQSTIDGIGQSTVPAIIDSQKIHESLADADRSAANAFLSGGAEAPGPSQQYAMDMMAAHDGLEQASEANAVGPRATQQLRQIMDDVMDYVGLVETARAYNRQGFPLGATYLRAASRLMHRPQDGILARVDALGTLNSENLDREGTSIWLAAATLAVFYLVACVILGLLLYTQGFLRSRFRRRQSPRVLAATILLIFLASGLALQAFYTYRNVEDAQLQAFARLQTLWQVRSLAVDANGNQSLSLIARGNGAAFDAAFKAETKQLVDRPLTDQLVDAAARGDVRFKGLLADEIEMATYPGEREAAVKALHAYQQFLQIDATVRDQAATNHEGAVSLTLGQGPGQLGAAFADLDRWLNRALTIDQAKYNEAIAAARPNPVVDAGVLLCAFGIALLVFWGLAPRIAEYTK